MLSQTIDKIEKKIQDNPSLKDKERAELLDMVSKLDTEVASLSETHAEHAESIKRFAEASTHEATRQEKNPQLLQLSLDGFSSSVEEFGADHPGLVQTVNSICHVLSNLGI